MVELYVLFVVMTRVRGYVPWSWLVTVTVPCEEGETVDWKPHPIPMPTASRIIINTIVRMFVFTTIQATRSLPQYLCKPYDSQR